MSHYYNLTNIIKAWTKEEREEIKAEMLKDICAKLNCSPEDLKIESFTLQNVRAVLKVSGEIRSTVQKIARK